MGQKKIKRSKTGMTEIDPRLEEVEEDRAFEIELDEEEKEIVLVHHYRRKWGDELEGDVEHCLNIQEADDLIGALVNGVEILKKIIIAENNALLIEKSTPAPIEGNPLRGPNNIEGK